MSVRACLRWAVALAMGATFPVAFAAPCAGFTDVDSTDLFCPNVDWLRNRAITLGCTTTTLYCPSNPVTRLSMAAFMNRLGVALTPGILYDEGAGATLDLAAPPATVCATPQLDAADHPRSAHAGAILSAFAGATTARLTLVQSTNGGGTWVPLNSVPSSVGGLGKWVNATVWRGNVPLAANVAYRFGLRVDSASGTGALGNWNCQLRAIVVSRTGSGVPY
jgi:hypothetical protein